MEKNEPNHRGIFPLRVDEAGRIVLPADSSVRQAFRAGQPLVGTEEPDGAFRVRPYADLLREIQDYCLQFGDPALIWSDELIDDRRTEARRE